MQRSPAEKSRPDGAPAILTPAFVANDLQTFFAKATGMRTIAMG